MAAPQTREQAHAITARNAVESPLLRLPAELRNKIYSYVYTEDHIRVQGYGPQIEWSVYAENCSTDIGYPLSDMLVTTTVCRQFHFETRLLPLRFNDIVTSTESSPYIIRTLTPALRAVTTLKFGHGTVWDVDLMEVFPCFGATGMRALRATEDSRVLKPLYFEFVEWCWECEGTHYMVWDQGLLYN
ncbi:hypothetical protein NX059_003733 [Plenodomus lindquistii]|nr:hypothetical protein NX059_003733 [Plenodomus lindquistii]